VSGRRGFTLVELAVAVCVIAILAGILLDRFTFYQEVAERTQMERTVAILRSALALKAAGLMTSGRFADIPSLDGDNPMAWLAERPANYIGERYDPREDEVPPGSWYYDRLARELVYRPRLSRDFVPDGNGRREARFRAVARVAGLPGAQGAARAEVSELTVIASRPYVWSAQP